MNLTINTDGASRGNPGPASFGFVIKNDKGQILHKEGKKIGIATNNIAEYTAVLEALQYVKENFSFADSIQVVADSLLVIQQLAGVYKIKNPKLRIIFDKIKSLEYELGKVFYKHVPREQNSVADKLANEALDK